MLASVVLQCLSVLGIIFTACGETSVKVNQYPESTSTNPGRNVSFRCTLPMFQDGPAVNVYWWKEGDNQYLSTGQDDRKLISVKTGFKAVLWIINVSVQDAGAYYCTVTHRGKIVGNGTGSNLVVTAPPTPLKIKSQQPEKDSSVSLTVVCVTSPFYPESISFTWYKDGNKTTTGISNVVEPNTDGLYEASSQLQETQFVLSGTVYSCLVSHSTLQISAMATYTVTYHSTGGENNHYLLISASAGGVVVLLVIGLIIAKRCVAKKNNGVKNDGERANSPEQQTMQGTADVMAPYAELEIMNPLKTPRPKHQERTAHVQVGTKQRTPDNKLTYAAVSMAGSKKTSKPNYKDKSTEYAQLRIEKQRADVISTEPKAT
ncbi:tyrosine-protein phosphatase non-receptor type substrate 1-like isoform X1 [Heterodontus francisci]|uniref:tyrosine-protein phosphatase non-receptor type substrate 1-like isoform X1 n=1 Tax=Heterodontus francisci TaxID=7792 RepID=UPI00355BA2FE